MIMMIVIPLLVFPLLINLVTSVSSSFADSAEEKIFKIGIIGDTNDYLAQKLNEIPNSFGPKELISYRGDSAKMVNDYENEQLDLLLFYLLHLKNIHANHMILFLVFLFELYLSLY